MTGFLAHAGSYLRTQCGVAEYFGRREFHIRAVFGLYLFELAEESGEQVFLGGAFLTGSYQRFVERRIGSIVGQTFYHVFHGNFEYHAHTALKVETEVQLVVFDIRISVLYRFPRTYSDAYHRFGGYGVEIILLYFLYGRVFC